MKNFICWNGPKVYLGSLIFITGAITYYKHYNFTVAIIQNVPLNSGFALLEKYKIHYRTTNFHTRITQICYRITDFISKIIKYYF
jgi:uncharacterized membrane protein